MFMDKTGKSTIVKRTSLLFIACIVFSGFTGVNAFAQHYLSHGVRDSLSHKEKTALAHDESRHLSWPEVENRVKSLDRISHYINPDIKGRGSVRARLSTAEKVNLLMEENRYFMHHDMPRLRKKANKPMAVLHLGKDYVYGSIQENLSAGKKGQLAHDK